MLLKSIEYFNFRPFLGKQRIEFSASNEKENVTVILGDNTRKIHFRIIVHLVFLRSE